MDEALASMVNGVFSSPELSTWPMAVHLSTFEFYKPNQQLIDLLCKLSSCSVAAKGGKEVLGDLQQTLESITETQKELEARHMFFVKCKIY